MRLWPAESDNNRFVAALDFLRDEKFAGFGSRWMIL